MTKYIEPTADVGVIIGRFQVDELHSGHHKLLVDVLSRHRKVLVLLGKAPVPHTQNNPLDFESRKQMLMRSYPELTVLYIRDVHDDDRWSRMVDATVNDWLSPTQTALLYGSRDSFISNYTGKFDTFELPNQHAISGTDVRHELGRAVRDSADWRAGVIWASRNKYPISYQTVDIAIFKPDYSQILMGKRDTEPAWRLPGGFADARSNSLEEDVQREAMEETNCKLDGIQYVCSRRIPDWRYIGEPDCIKTALFIATTKSEPVAGDDIDHVKWFDLPEVDPTNQHHVMSIHRPLVTSAIMKANTIRREASK
jgi:bifunctional NMN adenylyltransferase/nudix hydrolase